MKVLIVEDDFFSRQYFESIVKTLKYECRAVENGEEGLKTFQTFKPDIILSDIQMPKKNGLELLEDIRLQKSDVIVVMITAFDSEDYAIKALQLGANNYLKKPINHDNLLRILRKYKGILENRSIKKNIIDSIIRREFTMKIKSEINIVSIIVEQLIHEVETIFEDNELISIQLGLVELVTNSVEHGNLEIDYQEKTEALDNNTLEALYEERLSDPKKANRFVTIEFNQNTEYCQWLIKDEGDGFDWQNVKNPLEGESILELHGRGIFISRFQFDELEYLGNGNTVRVLKKRTKKEKTE